MPASETLLILALILVNGVFAGAEIAVVALRKPRIVELAEQGHRGANAVLALRADPERFLATVQVGITVVSSTAAVVGGASLERWLEPWFAHIPSLAAHAEGLSLAAVVVGISFLSVVLGELVPKSLALRGAERYALLIARPLQAVAWLARPVVWLLSASANLLLKPFGDRTAFTETLPTTAELQELVQSATVAGTIPPEAAEIASRALDLPELTAAEVMVPRQSVVMISRQASREDVRRTLLEHKFSRLPIHDGSVDNVVGYVTVKDVLALAWEKDLVVLEDLIRTPLFVLESKRVVQLLNDMRAQHVPFAVVVDEHGGMSGVVTLEDLLEELVGEMFSEYARQAPNTIRPESPGVAVVSGMTPVRDVNRELSLELPEQGGVNTLGGLCVVLAGKIPEAGQAFTLDDGTVLEVIEASARRVRSVRVKTAR